MKIVLLIFFLFASFCYAQTDWVKWGAKSTSYEIPINNHHDYAADNSSAGMKFLSFIRNGYYFLISDLDGDNCPFYPTCSAFFLESIKETNILKGTLMFTDRFIRDLNLFKGSAHYPVYKNGKLFDPAYNYTLNPDSIIFNSGGEFITDIPK